MPLFPRLFKKRTHSVIVCVDIGASTIGGAFVVFAEQTLPTIVYSKRVPIIAHSGENAGIAMLRALGVLGEALTREGSPLLLRATGSGSVSGVLVSLDAPWQTTVLRTETLDKRDSFVFTKHTARTMLATNASTPEDATLVNESIIGTLLNGYETRRPYGMHAHRATIIALSSYVPTSILESVGAELRSLYHTRAQFSIAGSSLRYQAIREAFPHEADALLLDTMGTEVSIALIRKGLLVATAEAPAGAPGTDAWNESTASLLRDIARQYPLPRTIFALAEEHAAETVRAACEGKAFATIWLTDRPPKIVFVKPSHLATLVTSNGAPDLLLYFMAIYWQHHEQEHRA